MACSLITVHTPGGDTRMMSRHEFAEYVERVFRYHNQIVSELIELSATDDSEESAELAKEEAHMLEACASLNEVVSQSMAGLDTNFRAKMQLVDAVPECEAATRRVEDLLP
jgi:23S rRNA pseudoU1915 N3-methylase RlmH